MKIKVVLVDDHKLFRDGLKSLLNDCEHIEVMGAYSCAEDLLKNISFLNVNIIITDISMGGKSGIDLARKISKELPCIKIIILSMHNNEEFIMQAMDAGAQAYLPKDIAGAELISAIEKVYDGQDYIHAAISQTIMKSVLRKKNEIKDNKELTAREIEVLKHVADGLMNKEIAEALHISIRTVDCHKNNIMNKLDLNTTAELVKYAIRHNLTEL
jgi:two-component system nitrate/nitrite response regulator NarL